MDLFENEVSNEKFRSTNELWNKLKLNTGWSVGCVSNIIKAEFENKEQWKDYYFDSGIERQRKLDKLTTTEKKELNNLLIGNYSGNNGYLNYEFGRTKEEIAEKGLILYRHIVELGNPLNITDRECKLMSFFRVVCETWNGIVIRENNTKNYIEKYFKNKGKRISLIDTSGKFDSYFGVDFEIYQDGNIICGLQVKPPSYNSNEKYLKVAKSINESKNLKYQEQFHRDVLYIYSKTSGEICNKEILTSLDDILHS